MSCRSDPAQRFQYPPGGGAKDWYRWVVDVCNFIAEQYGFECRREYGEHDPKDMGKLMPWVGGDDEQRAIVSKAFDVWWRSGRLDAEGWGDTFHGWIWLRSAQLGLSGFDGDCGTEARREWDDANPEWMESKRAEAAMMAGRLF